MINVRPEFTGYEITYKGIADAKYKRLSKEKDEFIFNVVMIYKPKSKDEWEDVVRSIIADLYKVEVVNDPDYKYSWHKDHNTKNLIQMFDKVEFAFALDDDTVLNCPIDIDEAYARQVVNNIINIERLTNNINYSNICEITDKLY